MKCGGLAYTGLPLAAMLTLAAVCLLTGVVLLLLARTRPRRISTAIMSLLLVTGGVAFSLSDPSPARATTPTCATQAGAAASNSLAIIQTSTLTGLAPGAAPSAITGVVINRGTDRTFVTSVTVSMVSVTQTVDHAAGRCNTSDYLLTGARMPVDQTIDPGQSFDFDGARISFRNKSTNQDACQAATITLRYISA